MAFRMAEAYVELSQRGFGGVMGAIGRVKGGLLSLGTVGAAGLTAMGAAAIGAGLTAVSLAAKSEQTAAAFETMLGSASAARDMLGDLEEFAASTPFALSDLAAGAKNLLAFGVAEDAIIDRMKMLGDISAGTGKPINDFVAIFGKVKATGKVGLETLNQLAERGVPIYERLRAELGVSREEMLKMISAGKVGFGSLDKALQATVDTGGIFAGGMERQSKTVIGLFSTLKDNVTFVMKDIGVGITDALDLRGGMSSIIDGIGDFRENLAPIIDRIVPSVRQVVDAASDAMGRMWGVMGQGASVMDLVTGGLSFVTDGLTFVMKKVTFVLDNWETLWMLGVEHVKLSMTNAWGHVQAFSQNAINVSGWFLENWRSILTDIGGMFGAAFENIAHNIQAALQPAQTTIAEMLLRANAAVTGASKAELNDQIATLHEDAARKQVSFKGVLDGFESSISEMPKIVSANVAESNKEIEDLKKKLKVRGPGEFAKAVEEESQKKKAVTASNAGSATAPTSNASGTFMALEAFSANVQTSALKRQEKLQQKANEHLDEIAMATQQTVKFFSSGIIATAGP